jgi:hypothetical protein
MSALDRTTEAKIAFERTGGFLGATLSAKIDTRDVGPGEAGEIAELLRAADFFKLPSRIMPQQPGADRFAYRSRVESAGREHTIVTADGAVPVELEPLLEYLTRRAKASHAGRSAE